MANQPAQNPNINLPGAEYLSLSPNRTISLQGRRVGRAVSALVSVPSNGQGQATAELVIENPFPSNAGIYIHDMWALWVPADSSGDLTITGFQMGFGLSAQIFYRVGIPLLTQLSPAGVMQMSAARDLLIHKSDILALGDTDTNVLNLGVVTIANNHDATLPHSFQVSVQCFYTRLDGIIL